MCRPLHCWPSGFAGILASRSRTESKFQWLLDLAPIRLGGIAMWSSGRLTVITLLASIWFGHPSVLIGEEMAVDETVHAEETCADVPVAQQRAADGDSRTAYELGRCYLNGNGV